MWLCYKWTTVLITTLGFFGCCYFFFPWTWDPCISQTSIKAQDSNLLNKSIPGKLRKVTNLSPVAKFSNLLLIFLYYYSLSLWYCARFACSFHCVCTAVASIFWVRTGGLSKDAEIAHAALSSSQALRFEAGYFEVWSRESQLNWIAPHSQGGLSLLRLWSV